MIWLLAQLDPDSEEGKQAIAQGWWNLSFILLIGTIAVLFLIGMILMRRWKHKHLKAIEQDRAERRAGRSAERVDAWSASAERYVDRDKLSAEDDEPPYDPGEERGANDENDPPVDMPPDPEEEDRDPFGLFKDKPYQDPDDDDDDFDDDEDDWDEEDEEDKPS